MDIEQVNVVKGQVPEDYHCTCRFCQKAIGELIRTDGTYYSRLERRQYYDPAESGEGGHIAKTPLHVARWAIQAYSSSGDWVLDPTMGAGTTAVEALVQGRNAAGMELQYEGVLSANVSRHARDGLKAMIRFGDARGIGDFLQGVPRPSLVVNNPPYSGDKTEALPGNKMRGKYQYNQDLPNLAFLKEGEEYWRTVQGIYSACSEHLLPGGHFVIGVKDQMRKKEPDGLHIRLAETLEQVGLEFVGTAFLRHYPGTLHIHTYEKRTGVKPPLYQTITVFRKGE